MGSEALLPLFQLRFYYVRYFSTWELVEAFLILMSTPTVPRPLLWASTSLSLSGAYHIVIGRPDSVDEFGKGLGAGLSMHRVPRPSDG